jgi:F420H(2)-dependent quinone reductase
MDDVDGLSTDPHVREETLRILRTGTTARPEDDGQRIVLVTTTGARSRKKRYVPVIRVEHEGSYAMVASKGGSARNPAWYHNVKAHPHVRLQDGSETRPYAARELGGAERALWWQRCVDVFPQYADYQGSTSRTIPVFVLEPMA